MIKSQAAVKRQHRGILQMQWKAFYFVMEKVDLLG